MEASIKLFVYGTLKRGRSNHVFLSESTYLGEYHAGKDYALYVAGLPYMVKEIKGGGVVGELYNIDVRTLMSIDRLEGHPSFYKREEIWVYDTEVGAEVKAYTYIYQGQINPETMTKLKKY